MDLYQEMIDLERHTFEALFKVFEYSDKNTDCCV